ncbi:hypothetical protein [uncultured Pelagimonas sp.]|uniref:hypothetical protein n=1 Tax=uncultured Pelagimonas sp. TaxID=1618102 RepID=UPI0026067B85|nr:hypothetical protein [uncultured Pelagimonas sp.]
MTDFRKKLPAPFLDGSEVVGEKIKGESENTKLKSASSTSLIIDKYTIEIGNYVENAGQHPVAQSVMYCRQNATELTPCKFLKINFVQTGDPNTPLRSPKMDPATGDMEFFMHVSMVAAVLTTLQLGPCSAHFEPQTSTNTPFGKIGLISAVEV